MSEVPAGPPSPVPTGWLGQPRYARGLEEADAPEPRGRGRGTIALVLLGALIGSLVTATFVHFRTPGTAEVQVSTSPVSGVDSDRVIKVAAQLGPAVGTVVNLGEGSHASLGSAFVFAGASNVSYLLTNNHVVNSAKELHVVMPSGASFTATLVGTDPLDDLAVISVPDAGLPRATFGSSANLKVGQQVIAIGSPLGNDGSVTTGVVSALHRTISAGDVSGGASETLQDVMQTDASINPGNSGGPLADGDGSVVGVNVAVASNIGFSIPADLARHVAEDLIAGNKVQHPFLGVAYLSPIDAVAAGKGFNGAGVLVSAVNANTPASAAGLKVGDIIVSVDGVTLDNGRTLGGVMQTKHVGDSVTFSVKRDGQVLTLQATLVEKPSTAK